MTTGAGDTDSTLTPDEAFAVLGNESRMEIIQELGAADEPLPFSELLDRVGISDSGQFNYHLDKLEAHFVRKTEAGYGLSAAGIRVIEAVVSGAVTDAPELGPTQVDDAACPYCDSSIHVDYRDEYLLTRCTNCPGTFSGVESSSRPQWTDPHGTIALYPLPPAGLRHRTLREALDAAIARIVFQSHSHGMCPRCSARLERDFSVCPEHTDDGGLCDDCHRRYAVTMLAECTNCPFQQGALAPAAFLAHPEFLVFFHRHGVNIAPADWQAATAILAYEEDVRRTDPLQAEFKWALGSEALVVAVD